MIILIAALILIIQPTIAFSQVELCGEPPPVANDEIKGEIKGKAEFLSKFLGNAALSGNIQKSRVEIFSKYPEAERTRSNTYFEYQVCVLLMKDTKLTTQQKIEELKKIRREFSEPLSKKSSMRYEETIEKNELPKSCNDAKYKNSKNINGKSKVDGKYYIEMEDHEGIKKILVDCDMTTDGGGWTKVKFKPLEKVSTCGTSSEPYTVVEKERASISTNYVCIGVYLRPLIHPFPRFQEIRGLEIRANQTGKNLCQIFNYGVYVNDKYCTSDNKAASKYNEENIWYCIVEGTMNIVLKHETELLCEMNSSKTEDSKTELWMGAGQGKNYIWVR